MLYFLVIRRTGENRSQIHYLELGYPPARGDILRDAVGAFTVMYAEEA